MIDTNSSALRLAPPTRAPLTFGRFNMDPALAGLTDAENGKEPGSPCSARFHCSIKVCFSVKGPPLRVAHDHGLSPRIGQHFCAHVARECARELSVTVLSANGDAAVGGAGRAGDQRERRADKHVARRRLFGDVFCNGHDFAEGRARTVHLPVARDQPPHCLAPLRLPYQDAVPIIRRFFWPLERRACFNKCDACRNRGFPRSFSGRSHSASASGVSPIFSEAIPIPVSSRLAARKSRSKSSSATTGISCAARRSRLATRSPWTRRAPADLTSRR